MNFNDAYRRSNDAVHVRESLRDQIEQQYAKETAPKSVRRRRWLVAVPTAFAAAAAVFVAVFVGVNAKNKNASTMLSAEVPEMAMNAAVYQEEMTAKKASVTAVSSYAELNAYISERSNSYYGFAEAAVDEATPTEQTEAKRGDTIEYSGTNVQVECVDEADIVKTDGTWIYVLRPDYNAIAILCADGANSAVVSEYRMSESTGDVYKYLNEMMLYGERLYVLGTEYNWNASDPADAACTVVEIFDVGNRFKIKHVATLRQAGTYKSARLIDDTLLVVSAYGMYSDMGTVDEIPYGCPAVYSGTQKTVLAPQEIYVNDASENRMFTVVTTLNAATGNTFASKQALLGGCDVVYCNEQTLLIASREWTRSNETVPEADGTERQHEISESYTSICAFAVENGKVEPTYTATVNGMLLNQFSIDADEATYRFVVSRIGYEEVTAEDGFYDWHERSDCALYVFDDALRPIGAIENLADGEMVQSVRFLGDVVYFVTFRQVDPLFAVDLSDPTDPKILSELKITGFSSYLHPFGDGRLVGIGFEADADTGRTEGVKVSLYDVSDPKNVTELLRQTVDADWTNVQQNHKAVYADADSGLVAFPVDDRFIVCRVSDAGVELLGSIDMGNSTWFGSARGVSIGDCFYVVSTDAVTVLSIDAIEILAEIQLAS